MDTEVCISVFFCQEQYSGSVPFFSFMLAMCCYAIFSEACIIIQVHVASYSDLNS